jgi:predicted metal-dependent phosphotriesterase family hydrolase
VLPRLRESGISNADIDKLTVANPARLLSREAR